MNDRVVCVMSVGAGKYRKQYELVRDNLMAYAKKCHCLLGYGKFSIKTF